MARVRRKSLDLHRGDASIGIVRPDPSALRSLVAHILQFGGRDQPTPYTSTSDVLEYAKHFAFPGGIVWHTNEQTVTRLRARVISLGELRHLLRGFGKGKAKWNDAWEVKQALGLAEYWREHIIDWSGHPDVANAIVACFWK